MKCVIDLTDVGIKAIPQMSNGADLFKKLDATQKVLPVVEKVLVTYTSQ